MRRKVIPGTLIFGLLSITLLSQQIADTTYNPAIVQPEYAIGKGPVVAIDEGHYNFHSSLAQSQD